MWSTSDDDSDDGPMFDESSSSEGNAPPPTAGLPAWGQPVVQAPGSSSSSRPSSPAPKPTVPKADIPKPAVVPQEPHVEGYDYRYEGREYYFPAYSPTGPKVMIIVDSNLRGSSKGEYDYYLREVDRLGQEVRQGRRNKSDSTLYYATDSEEELYTFCIRNIAVLRTYCDHPDKLRFVTNSHRADTCAGRGVPTEAGKSFVDYVRDNLRLTGVPIVVYYYSSTACLRLHDPARLVFCTNKAEVFAPYAVYGRLPGAH